jgi:hypothetical protein
MLQFCDVYTRWRHRRQVTCSIHMPNVEDLRVKNFEINETDVRNCSSQWMMVILVTMVGKKGNQKISGNVSNQLHVVHLPGLHGLCMLILPDFNQTWISCQILVKPASIKLMKNPSNESRTFSWERTVGQAWQLVVAFRCFPTVLGKGLV